MNHPIPQIQVDASQQMDKDREDTMQAIRDAGKEYMGWQLTHLDQTIQQLQTLNHLGYHTHMITPTMVMNRNTLAQFMVNNWNPHIEGNVYRPAWEATERLRLVATEMTNDTKPLIVQKYGYKLLDIVNNMRWFFVSWAWNSGSYAMSFDAIQHRTVRTPDPDHPGRYLNDYQDQTYRFNMHVDDDYLPVTQGPNYAPRAPRSQLEIALTGLYTDSLQVLTYIHHRFPTRTHLVHNMIQTVDSVRHLIFVMHRFDLGAQQMQVAIQDFDVIAAWTGMDPNITPDRFPNNIQALRARYVSTLNRINAHDIGEEVPQ